MLAEDQRIEAQSRYNAGNALYRMGRLEDAVGQYLRTLELDPDDEDARFNLEFVRREMERRREDQQQRRQEQQEQEKQQQEETRQGSDKDNQPQEQDDKGSRQDKERQEKSGQPPPDGGDEKTEDSTNPNRSPESETPDQQRRQKRTGSARSGGMSEENIQQLLDVVEADSAENMREFLRNQQPAGTAVHEKDW